MNSREQFEAHYDDWAGAPVGTASFFRVGDTYSSPKVSAAWVHWQASRAALVVELPAIDDPDCGQRVSFHLGAYKVQCRQAIEADGVKVAP